MVEHGAFVTCGVHLLPVKACFELGCIEKIYDPENFYPMHDRKEHFVLGHKNQTWHAYNIALMYGMRRELS